MKCPQCSHDNSEAHQFCEVCRRPLTVPTGIRDETVQDSSIRYHGLDALRSMAMLLGIVLHSALPYVPNIEAFWPADESSSRVIGIFFQFIHIWRMPLFFILAGFFAKLVISRKSWASWWGNRLIRIGLPMILFFPLMSLSLPWIFKYGKTGEFILFYSSEGQPFHLWFLWHLMIFVLFTVILRLPYLGGVGVLNSLNRIKLGFVASVFHKSKFALSSILFRSRFPIGFIIACFVINLPTGGELIINPVGSGLYFVIGYSLYGNASLFAFLKAHWRYYFLAGIFGFTLFMILNLAEPRDLVTDIYNDDITYAVEKEEAVSKLFSLLQYLLKITCGILFSYAFIGLSEKRFGSYNAKMRFISDGAYWMYLVHLPIVTLITFFMFKLQLPVEVKFLIAILITSIICLGTYKYIVRSTFIGILLNGRSYPFKSTGF